jgi:NADPH2:quinone reductase
MKAVQIVHTGAAELLELRDVTVPVPGRGEVSIDAAFVGVNFADPLCPNIRRERYLGRTSRRL